MSIQSSVQVVQVQFEHLHNALGIGVARPRISWQVTAQAQNWLQAAYEIEAAGPAGTPCCTTGKVESGQSVLLAWPFAPLASRQRLAVRVRVWGADGSASPWSQPAALEAALLDAADWSARFITPAWPAEPLPARPAPLLRKEFELRAGIAQARLYISALGVYEAQLNGQPVHDHVMAPGWTAYQHRLRYQVCDVTALLRPGRNALGALLGDGWFRGRLGFGGGQANLYGDRLALLAQLEVTYADGSTQQVVSDPSWRAATGPILENDIYDGERYDARLELPGWSQPGFDEAAWAGVELKDWDLATLFAPMGPPVRRTQLVAPVSIFTSPSGQTLVDFGQNLVGRLRITVQGPAGQTVTLRHAEVLEKGELGTRPLRHAKATDQYTLKGGEAETWEPRFTFHGFRYAEISGWPGQLQAADLNAVVCHSDMQRTGWFECSDALLNQLHSNVVWSMRGNFLDIPSDCPQRDERLGWTGDIQIFSPTASYLYDCAGFLSSWLRDVAAEQREYGTVPFVVPNIIANRRTPAAAWGDAATFIPWVLYQRFGDLGILAAQYESMRAWVDLLDSLAGEGHLWDQGFQFGDWLDPAAPPENPAAARTPAYLIASAFFARSAELVGLAAGLLGNSVDQQRYLQLAGQVRTAFNREYVTPSGRMLSDAATAYALALQFALLPEAAQRQHAAKRLAELARASGFRISTGFVGTPLICDALANAGQLETAFRLLTAKENPSWLYPVTMGATTIWERWDSMLPDGSINPGQMTSFNHYALGAVADWMHRTIGGLAPAEPGYRRIEFRPRVGAGLTQAATRHQTPYGLAACAWQLAGGQLQLQVEVPANTQALVYLPGQPESAAIQVGSGQYSWSVAYTPPGARPASLTMDSTVGELLDHPAALSRALEIIARYDSKLIDRILAQEQMPLRQALAFLPHNQAILDDLSAALASL